MGLSPLGGVEVRGTSTKGVSSSCSSAGCWQFLLITNGFRQHHWGATKFVVRSLITSQHLVCIRSVRENTTGWWASGVVPYLVGARQLVGALFGVELHRHDEDEKYKGIEASMTHIAVLGLCY